MQQLYFIKNYEYEGKVDESHSKEGGVAWCGD